MPIKDAEASYYKIESLPDFDLEKTEPIKIRPFKPKYHLTMGMLYPPFLLLNLRTPHFSLSPLDSPKSKEANIRP
jgi:hypothetical protein